MIQGGVIGPQLFHEDTFPNYVNLVDVPKIGELSHGAASSAASAASNAFNGFKTYVDNFRTGLGQHVQIPPKYPVLHRFVHGEIWPSPGAGVVPSQLVAPGLYGNYGGHVGDSGAASAAAASAAASEGLAKRRIY